MVTLKSLLVDSKGVLFHSPRGTSEYAEIGKRIIYQMCEQNVPTSWYQFIIDDTKNDDSDFVFQRVKNSLNKNIEFDTVVFCCDPDIWNAHLQKFEIKFLNKRLIGYITWETDKFPELWVGYCNLLNEIWVPSKFVKCVLEKCGVEIPIKIVSYPFIEKNLLEINSKTLSDLLSISKWYGNEKESFQYGSDWKIFYTIGEWNDRKNIEGVLESYCKAFTSNDKVKLIIKTYRVDYSDKNVLYCVNQIETFLKKFPNYPEILLITENNSYKNNVLIHSIGDCYVSLSRGDGFCLDVLDAFNYKKDIIVTEFGGCHDCLGENYNGYVSFSMIDVNNERNDVSNCNQKWAEPFIEDCVKKLKDIKNRLNLVEESPIILKSGWFFKEKKDGIVFRQSSEKSSLMINGDFDFVKLKVKYENGSSTKNLFILVDSTIKRNFTLTRGVDQEILIPIFGVKHINFSIESDDSEKTKWDHRNLGFLLKTISLIKNNSISIYGMDNVSIENELSEFCVIEKYNQNYNKTVGVTDDNPNTTESNIIKLEIKNNDEFTGILYIGQYGTSGYATAAKGNLIHFFTKGIPVSWVPLYFDNSQLSNECFYNAMVKSLIKKRIDDYDTVIIHCTPDIWPEIKSRHGDLIKDKKTIGYTVWETNKLPYLWVESINDCVDEVWCPSTYNQTVFEESGVRIPIKVFPHIFMPKELPPKQSVLLKTYKEEFLNIKNSHYIFYNISELNPRKGVEDLVKTFCESFSSIDKVCLILKIHYKNYEDKNKKYCLSVINNIISSYNDPPNIHIILDNLTEREMLGLHSIGDCYVSLCKSEGFGLTIFEAFKYDKKIIATGYGGYVDFLGKDHAGLVNYTLGNVSGMDDFAKYYADDQKWAYPDLNHAKKLMKSCL